MRQLTFRMTRQEVDSILATKNLDECKQYLDKEVKYRSDLLAKFLWLGVSERQFDESAILMDKPDFRIMAKEFETGKCTNEKD